MKKILMAGIAFLAIASLNQSKAASIKVEPVFAEKSMVLDTKSKGTLPYNIGYFMRNRTTLDYENNNNANEFLNVDLTYPLGRGADFVFENQFTAGKPYDPRLGVQYFKDFENGLTFYILVTRNWGALPNTEITPVIGYERSINPRLRFAGRLEECVNIGDKKYNFDLTRLRLGIGNKDFIMGPALDVSGIGSGKRPEYTPAVFLQFLLK